jgi:DNA topoisomerase I
VTRRADVSSAVTCAAVPDTANPPGLVQVSTDMPGLRRRRRGRGFSYLDEHGNPISDAVVLARVKSLAIPPAWRDVWICPLPDGHLQAVGTDAAGRRQYRYHDEWRWARDREKHERVLVLGEQLPEIRAEVTRRLAMRGLNRDRVLAAGVRMLDSGMFRSGGEEYAPDDEDDDEGSFGLATLRREHVRLRPSAIEIEYTAKGGNPRSIRLRDPALRKVIGGLLRRRDPAPELLAWRNGRAWRNVRATDLNDAVKELAGDGFTCKDLRTWNATVLAGITLAELASDGVPRSTRARTRLVTATMEVVSEHLGNTPAVARSSYVDPRVIECFDAGRTVLPALQQIGFPTASGQERSTIEGGGDFLDDATRAALDRTLIELIRSREDHRPSRTRPDSSRT